jgi:uncharacterized protein (TIGR00106 family)
VARRIHRSSSCARLTRPDGWCSSARSCSRRLGSRPDPPTGTLVLEPTTWSGCPWPHGPPGETMVSMLAAFSITPLGTGESVGDLVAEAVRIVRASGLPNETNAMFTNIEGEWDEVMAVIKACVDTIAQVAPRVSVVVKLDHRPNEPSGRLLRKMESVERKLMMADTARGVRP